MSTKRQEEARRYLDRLRRAAKDPNLELRERILNTKEWRRKRLRRQGCFAVYTGGPTPSTPVRDGTEYESFSEGGWRDHAFRAGADFAAKEAAR